MSCRCCNNGGLDWKYFLFLVLLGISFFAIITAITAKQKQKFEKNQKAQVVQA